MYIKLLGFFLGFLITLIIINYISIQKLKVETFDVINPIQMFPAGSVTPAGVVAMTVPAVAPVPVVPPVSTPVIAPATVVTPAVSGDLLDAKFIPYKGNKYMSINTFTDVELISNSERRWYESDVDKTKTREITENMHHYFTFNNTLNLIPNEINKNGSLGANLTSIQLNGPKSFFVANNRDTNEVSEFTVIISGKIKEVVETNNILFEMTGNTETINAKNLDYSPSLININLIKTPIGNFDISITIGNVVYKGLISNIDKNTILLTEFTIMCLIYTPTEITFYLNRQKFTYKNTETFKVKLGSTPLIINKNGLINMDLYNFIYYKTFIPIDEINKFTKNTYYYLSGLDFSNSNCKGSVTQLVPIEYQQVNILENRIKELETQYIKTLEQKTNDLINSKLNKPISNIIPLSYDTNNNYHNNKNKLPINTDRITNDIAAKGVKLMKEQSFKDKYFGWLF